MTLSVSIAEKHATEVLAPRGLDPDFVARLGVHSITTPAELPEEFASSKLAVVPALVIPWHSPTQGTLLQLRPDEPLSNGSGDPVKYVFPSGSAMVLNELRGVGEVAPDALVIIAEGSFQSMTALRYAPKDVAVYGMSGCWSWRKGETQVSIPDLIVAEGHPVIVALDADAASNLAVYNAGLALAEALAAEGATSVRFLRLAGAGAKAGLDDVLGSRPEDKRASYLANLIESAKDKPADVKPKAKRAGSGAVSPFFDGASLKVKTLAEAVVTKQPAMLTKEDKVALYMGGVYRIDGTGFLATLTDLLGENFRTSHAGNVEGYVVGQLAKHNLVLPERMDSPLMNCRNGMVDLRTGELIEHDPRFRSTVQFPVDYDPDATAPRYEEWTRSVGIDGQLDDLEETVALMLDPTVTPSKAVFLFGAARSGKSTFLRLMQEVAGSGNYTAVTLHQLAEDRFAAANLYGKVLNVAADLSAAHVEDVSIFKMMTGEDPIQANRKFGSQFAFVNRALFAFSANDPPTVGESSRAYVERIKPFHFGYTFAGHENPAIEAGLREEIPGILARWVRAGQRRTARGVVLPTDPRVRDLFEIASDRVRQFVAECCEILDVETAKGGSKGSTASTTTELYLAFRRWAEDEGRAALAKSKFRQRLANAPGVVEAVSSGRSRGWNLRVMTPTEREFRRPDSGTLSVSTYFSPRDSAPPEVAEVSVHSQASRPKLTKFQSLPDFISGLAVEVDPPECPDCDGAKELVPPALFWYACRRCHPGTFPS